LKHDDQLRDLQNHFQALLDQRILQLQDDAQEQIYQLKNQEKELQGLLEEKMLQLEKDYIKLSLHDEVVNEKQSLIEKLKQEISKREADHKHELTIRLRSLEERLNEEFGHTQRSFKSIYLLLVIK
jgi:hypothetical protein